MKKFAIFVFLSFVAVGLLMMPRLGGADYQVVDGNSNLLTIYSQLLTGKILPTTTITDGNGQNIIAGTGTQAAMRIQGGGASPVLMGFTNGSTIPAHLCNHIAKAHITTATSTEIIAASGTRSIFICDYEISWGGTGNIYLESATASSCSGATQITGTWYGVLGVKKEASNPFLRGLTASSGNALCAVTDQGVPIDILVYYDQL